MVFSNNGEQNPFLLLTNKTVLFIVQSDIVINNCVYIFISQHTT